jgi:predicted outer membrane repeat protein
MAGRIGVFFGAVFFANLTLSICSGAEIHVPADYSTIAQAIHIATEGDTIIVAPDVYNENLGIFAGKSLTLTSENPLDPDTVAATILDGGHNGAVITLNGANPCVIQGFTITNGVNSGIYIYDCHPTISNCVIKNNSAIYGGGIFSVSANPVISDCTIIENAANSRGGAIYCKYGSPIITHCRIHSNTSDNGGGIYFYANPDAVLSDCTITGNLSSSDAGAIHIYQNSTTIRNCTIVGNQSLYAGGVHLTGGNTCSLESCILWDNEDNNSDLQVAVGGSSTVTISYCNLKGGQSGQDVELSSILNWGGGNVDGNPMFMADGYWDDRGTPGDRGDDEWVEGDYHLVGFSPCIDAGDPAYLPDPTVLDLGGDERLINQVVDMGPYESDVIEVTKMTCKVGKTRASQADSFSLSGKLYATESEFQQTNTLTVQIGPYQETLDLLLFKQSGNKPKYSYKVSGARINQVKLDLMKNTFSISAKNLDLTGLSTPVPIGFFFNDYYGVGQVLNDVINGSKSMPLQFLQGAQNFLRIDSAKFKGRQNVGTLTVQGAIAAADTQTDLNAETVTLTVGTLPSLTISQGRLAEKKTDSYSYKGTKPIGLTPYVSQAQFDFNKCTFKIVIKNLDILGQNNTVDFGIAFTGFDLAEPIQFR